MHAWRLFEARSPGGPPDPGSPRGDAAPQFKGPAPPRGLRGATPDLQGYPQSEHFQWRHKIKFRKLMPLADRERLTIHSASAQTKGPGIPSPPSPLTGLLLYKEVLFLNVAT